MDIYTNNTIQNMDWYYNNPNGGPTINNVIVTKREGKTVFMDFHTDHASCLFCTIPDQTTFNLRGICKNSYLGFPKKLSKED